MKQCDDGTALDREMGRLVQRDGFTARVIGSAGAASFDVRSFRSAAQVREAARKAPRGDWAGFQLYYPMSAAEVRACSGMELVTAILGVFGEVAEAMNQCMQIRLQAPDSLPSLPPPSSKQI